MKCLFFILLILANSSILFAQSSISDLYKQWIVEDINRGQYAKVVSMIDMVEEWEYIHTDQTPYIIPEKFDSLMHYIESQPKRPINTDSLIIYYSEELLRISNVYLEISQLDLALELDLGVSQIREQFLGMDHPLTAVAWCNLGLLYSQMGDFALSEYYLQHASNTLLKTVGSRHPYYVSLLNCLGILAEEKGLYLQAEQYYMQEMQIEESIHGKNSIQYGTVINNLAHVYDEIGDYARALDLYTQHLRIVIDNEGRNNLTYANAMINLGMCCKHLGWYSDAEEWLRMSFPIFLEQVGDQSPLYANALNNYGVVLCALKRQKEAEGYFLKALAIRERSGNVYGSISTIRSLAAIAEETYHDNKKAEQYWLHAMELSQNAHNEHGDLNHANLLANIFTFYSDINNYKKACKYYIESSSIYRKICTDILDNGSEDQRLLFWSTIAGYYYNIFPNYYYKYRIQEFIPEQAYNNELFAKGILLASSENVRRSIFESGNTTLIGKWNNLTFKREQIRELKETTPLTDQIQSLIIEAEQLEKDIMQISAPYRTNRQQMQIQWEDVRRQLSSVAVAVEFFIAPISSDSVMYIALLVRGNSTRPIFIPLFEEKEVASLINTTTENKTSFTYSYGGNGKQLSQLVWSKILPYIKQGETVYFAPSGLLHQLAIEALPYDSTYTMGDIFNLVRLSSTREIVTRKHDAQYSSATLYGGIQYDMDTTMIKTESARYPEIGIKRSLDNDTLNRGKIDFLKGTKTEVENINTMLKQNNLQVQLFTSTNANEESVKALSGKHQNILHIATHGFFWTDSMAHKKDYFSQRVMTLSGEMPIQQPIDPLNRCGLLFSGAQMAWSGHSTELPDGVQDGILTAKEISLLDLRDADLVVLSACETGKGEITGDGVFGLQRAFKQAGVHTLIMSLWKVDDAATQLLMTEFYRNWITNHQSKHEAFRKAQNAVRNALDKYGKRMYEDPYFWAGFIMLD